MLATPRSTAVTIFSAYTIASGYPVIRNVPHGQADVPGRTTRREGGPEYSTLEHEAACLRRTGQPVQEPFQGVGVQQLGSRAPGLAGQVLHIQVGPTRETGPDFHGDKDGTRKSCTPTMGL
jgi:hypothetical protein